MVDPVVDQELDPEDPDNENSWNCLLAHMDIEEFEANLEESDLPPESQDFLRKLVRLAHGDDIAFDNDPSEWIPFHP